MKILELIIENFADGRRPEDRGDSRRHGIPKSASLAQLDKIGRGGGRRGQLARWQANMRRGRARSSNNEGSDLDMRVTELFGKKDTINYSVDWEDSQPDHILADFTVGNKNYRFQAYQDVDEAPGDWEIEFYSLDSLPADVSPYGITGAGRSSEVFSTVVNIIRNFIRKRGKSIRRLVFAAKEGSRQDLYARMVRRLLPDWTFDQSGTDFVLTRPNLTWWVYSVEPPYNKIAAVKVTAASADRAKESVMNEPNSPFKGAAPVGMTAGANRPRR